MTNIHRRGFLTGAATIVASSTSFAETPKEESRMTTKSLPEHLRKFGYEPVDDGDGHFPFKVEHGRRKLELRATLVANDNFVCTYAYVGKVANTATEKLRRLLLIHKRIRPAFIELDACKEGDECIVYTQTLLPNDSIGPDDFRSTVHDVVSAYDRVSDILAE